MAVSNAIGFFIMLTAAPTLHAHGAVEIQSSAQAAEALLPIAGRFAFLLFSLGKALGWGATGVMAAAALVIVAHHLLSS